MRALARDFGIPVADKPDSMEICFIPQGDYGDWLEARGFSTLPGNFVDKSGHILGQHKGIHRYTLGQGRGLGVSGPHRYFVTELRPDTCEVVLSDGSDLGRDTVRCVRPNWLAADGLTCTPPPGPPRRGSWRCSTTATRCWEAPGLPKKRGRRT